MITHPQTRMVNMCLVFPIHCDKAETIERFFYSMDSLVVCYQLQEIFLCYLLINYHLPVMVNFHTSLTCNAITDHVL